MMHTPSVIRARRRNIGAFVPLRGDCLSFPLDFSRVAVQADKFLAQAAQGLRMQL